MKPIKTLTIPESIAGKEWAGKYVVNELNAIDYLKCTDIAIQYCKATFGENWDGKVPQAILQATIVSESVTKGDSQSKIVIDMPSKIYEIFSVISLPANTLSVPEYESLFFDSTTAKKPN